MGLAGQGGHRHAGQQVERDLGNLQPDPVLGGVVEGEAAQAGCAGGADGDLGSGVPHPRRPALETVGVEFGRGLVNYPAADILRVKGRRSTDISRTLGYKVADEIIHRDNFVLLQDLA